MSTTRQPPKLNIEIAGSYFIHLTLIPICLIPVSYFGSSYKLFWSLLVTMYQKLEHFRNV